ncbi:hypothetical protein ACWEV3_17885 [Saccharopolyspora sp. NPDC003752]
MTVIGHGIIAPDHPHRFTDALDRVFFHMGSALDDVQARKIAAYLADGRHLPAAEAMASIAAAKQRTMSSEDCSILRTVVEAYNGDLTQIRRMESQVATGTPPSRSKPHLLRLA